MAKSLSYTRPSAPLMNRGVRVAGTIPWKAVKITTPESVVTPSINPQFKKGQVLGEPDEPSPGSADAESLRVGYIANHRRGAHQ